jgi:hypothetical protein
MKHFEDVYSFGFPSGLLYRKLSDLEPGVVKICDASGSVYHSCYEIVESFDLSCSDLMFTEGHGLVRLLPEPFC